MKTTTRSESIHEAISRLADDFPEEQSRVLAVRLFGERFGGKGLEGEEAKWIIVNLEREIHAHRQHQRRRLEHESRLGSGKPRPATNGELESMIPGLLEQVMKKAVNPDWTPEVRASTIALGDGTRIALGEATGEQIQQRLKMMAGGVVGTLEGMQLLEAALRDMAAAGARTLNEMVRKLARP